MARYAAALHLQLPHTATMPYQNDQLPSITARLEQLDPDLVLVEPDDEGYPVFLARVNELDSDLAQQIERAVIDEQAEKARSMFGSSNSPVQSALNKFERFSKGESTRGKRKVRPATFLVGFGVLAALLFAVTALIPEQKDDTKVSAISSAVPGQSADQPCIPAAPSGAASPTPGSSAAPEATTNSTDCPPAAAEADTPTQATTSGTAPTSAPPTAVSGSSSTAPVPTGYVGSPNPIVAESVPVPSSSPVPNYASTVPEVPAMSVPSPVGFESFAGNPSAPTASMPVPSRVVAQSTSTPNAQPNRVTLNTVPRGLVTGTHTAVQQDDPPTGLISVQAERQVPTREGSVSGLVSAAAQETGSAKGLVEGSFTSSPAQAVAGQPTGLVSGGTMSQRSVDETNKTITEAEMTKGGAASGLVGGPPLQTEGPTPVPTVAQAGAAPQPSAALQTATQKPSYQPGQVLNATLDTGLTVVEGTPFTVWARAADGSTWRGVATLAMESERISIKFTEVLVGGSVYPVNAYAESVDGPGLGGHVKTVTKDAAKAAFNSVMNAAVGFVQSQASNQVTYTQNTVIQTQQPQNFWVAMGGGLAQALQFPNVKATTVKLGAMSKGDAIQIRVDITPSSP